MKIALVLDDSLDRPDGVQQYVLTLGDYFSEQGHEVHYITTKTNLQPRPLVHSLGKSYKTRFNGNVLTLPMPIKSRKARRLIKNERFDVVHVQLPFSPLFSGKLITMLPKSTVIVGTFHILPYGLLSRIGTKLLGMVSRRALRKFDKIYSVSKPAKAFAQQSYGVRTTLLANAVNVQSYVRSTGRDNELRVVFLGRLVKRKGGEQFVKIMAELSKREPSFLIDVAGDGPERPRLERLVGQYGLSDRVAFHGFVDEDTKRELLAQSTIAVFPSLGGESFGIVLTEAMATGSVVVMAGDNPGYRSVLQDNENQLFDPRSPVEAADKILRYLNSHDERDEALAWQNKLVTTYDVAVIGSELLKQYEGIAKKKHVWHNKNNA